MVLLTIELLFTFSVALSTNTPPPPNEALLRIVAWLPVMTSPSNVRLATLGRGDPAPADVPGVATRDRETGDRYRRARRPA